MLEGRNSHPIHIKLSDRITAFFALFIDVWLMDDGRQSTTGLVLRLNQDAHDEP
jgi:hypothetical protein